MRWTTKFIIVEMETILFLLHGHRSFIKRRRKKEGPSCFDVCWEIFLFYNCTIWLHACIGIFIVVVFRGGDLCFLNKTAVAYNVSSAVSFGTTVSLHIIVPNSGNTWAKSMSFTTCIGLNWVKNVFHAYSTRIPCVTLMVEPQQIIYSGPLFLQALLYRSNWSIKLVNLLF